jgi:hypothetical protein
MIIGSAHNNRTMPTGKLRAKVVRKDGSIKQEIEQDVDSFVISHWSSYVHGIHTGTGSRLAFDAGGGTNAYNGIIVGSGATAVAYSNTALATQILHGSTTGRLLADPPTISYDTSNGELTLTREFENVNTVAGITVNECGIRVDSGNSTSETGGLLIVRDLLSSTLTVLQTEVLTVEYTILLPYGTNNYNRLFTQHLIGRNNDNMVLINQSGTTVEGTFGSGNPALNFVTTTMANNRGIVLGTGSTAESFSDITLATPIANGTGAGELIYGVCSNSLVVSNTTTSNFSEWLLIRYFENKSGSNINVNEVGLVSNATINSTNQVYLFDRRVLATPVEVADNAIVTAIWKFRYDF